MKVRYFTKSALIDANTVAIETHRNRTMHPEMLEGLDNDTKFPITFSMPHNDVEMRVNIVMSVEPELRMAMLDIPFETYHNLPEGEVNLEEA